MHYPFLAISWNFFLPYFFLPIEAAIALADYSDFPLPLSLLTNFANLPPPPGFIDLPPPDYFLGIFIPILAIGAYLGGMNAGFVNVVSV